MVFQPNVDEQRKQYLSRIAKMLHDRKWDNLSEQEQKVLEVKPAELPFIFITLDKIKNQVNIHSIKTISPYERPFLIFDMKMI